jgi:predicted ATP-dependent endonuclease of OLD family
VIEKADGTAEGTNTGDTLRPRLLALMTPWMNEGFFADVVVLVEGEEDRAAIIGAANAKDLDLESSGITIIPCNGKRSIDRPVAILNQLRIPTYAIWDSDEGDGDANPEDNHRLLRLFGDPIEDWPDRVADRFACFKHNLRTTLCAEIGQPLYDEVLRSCCERLCLGKNKHAAKNPIVIRDILREAYQRGKSAKTLDLIVSQIAAIPR